MLIRKQSEEDKKKCMDGGKHENVGNKGKKFNNIGNIGGFVNI